MTTVKWFSKVSQRSWGKDSGNQQQHLMSREMAMIAIRRGEEKYGKNMTRAQHWGEMLELQSELNANERKKAKHAADFSSKMADGFCFVYTCGSDPEFAPRL